MIGSAIVIGGGIGGVAAAIGLSRIGWEVTVLEQAPQFSEVGAGLSQSPNALRAMDELGVGDRARAIGLPSYAPSNVRAPSGGYRNRARPGDSTPLLGFHRADLHGVLMEAAPQDSLRTDARVSGIAQSPDGATVTVDGQTLSADLVVAADGIHSTARRLLWPDVPQPSFWNYTVWRGVAKLGMDPIEGSMTMGRGQWFLITPIVGGRTYWVLGSRADDVGIRYDDELGEVRRRVAGWHDPIPAILDATPADAVLHHDITDLENAPLSTFVKGRVALLGDAAHPTSPDLAQGAAMAIEDAVVLAASLAEADDVTSALSRYDTERRPRTRMITKAAHQNGAGIISDSPVRHRIQGLSVRMIPSSYFPRLSAKALGSVWDWKPPNLSRP